VTVDLTGLLEQACRTRDALQVEIDAAIDRHGVICRFIDGMSGPAEPPALRNYVLTHGLADVPDTAAALTPPLPAEPDYCRNCGGRNGHHWAGCQ